VIPGRGDGSFGAPAPATTLGAFAGDFRIVVPVLKDLNGDNRADLAGFDPLAGHGAFVSLNAGHRATRTWVGPADGGNWSAPANWSPGGVPAPSDVVAVAGASVHLSGSATVAGLVLTGGASLAMAAGGGRVFRTSDLTIDGSSALNLDNYDLILDYSGTTPHDRIATWLAPGRAIHSSLADHSGGRCGLALAEAKDVFGLTGTQTATFAGQAVDATTLLVRLTAPGDADLDGTVGFADLVRVAQNYNAPSGGTWVTGDFNHDGRVDFADLVLFAQDFNDGAAVTPVLGAPVGSVAPASRPCRPAAKPRGFFPV
jgi:hypothetical protein